MDIKNFIKWLVTQPVVAKILALVAMMAIAIAILFFTTSCGVARSSVTGDRVVDKNVKDSTHYEVVLEK